MNPAMIPSGGRPGLDFPLPDVQESLRLLVPGPSVGAIIGKKGSNLRQFRENFGADVKVEPQPFLDSGERLVTMSGAWQGAALLQLCVSISNEGSPSALQMLVPDSAAGGVVGKGGAEMKAVYDLTRTRVSMAREPTPSEERIVSFTAPDAEGLAMAVIQVSSKATSRKRGRSRGDDSGGQYDASKRQMMDWPQPQVPSSFAGMEHQGMRQQGPGQQNVLQMRAMPASIDISQHFMPQPLSQHPMQYPMPPRPSEPPRASFMESQPHLQTLEYPLGMVPMQQQQHQQQQREQWLRPENNGEDSLMLVIQHQNAGKVIGKAGAGFKLMREQYGATLKITDDPAFTSMGRLLCIYGDVDTQQKAGTAIVEKAAGILDGKTVIHLLVPARHAGAVIGKGGQGLTQVRQATGAYVSMQREELAGMRIAMIAGPDASAVAGAVSLLAATLANAS